MIIHVQRRLEGLSNVVPYPACTISIVDCSRVQRRLIFSF